MRKMRMFLRKPARPAEPLALTMSGARMGERLLQIGIDDAALCGALAAKTGLSGHAAVAVATEHEAERARAAGAEASAHVDVCVTPYGTLPFTPESFDAVVVHGTGGRLASLDEGARVAAVAECRRVLRHGGRILVIESEPKGGLGGLLRPRPAADGSAYDRAGGAIGALKAGGFSAVRHLATREGYRFVEGLKG
jgi:SAM-dependent methyltransferase